MIVGQCIWAKLKYRDGKGNPKNRPYLIVGVNGKKVKILTISSTYGKEDKLIYKSNYRLKNFKPPFIVDSFVKLDSCQEIDLENVKYKIGDNGKILNSTDLNEILRRLKYYDK